MSNLPVDHANRTSIMARLPKPVRWLAYAGIAIVAFKVLAIVLAIVSTLVFLAVGGAFIALVAAVVYALLKKR